MVDGMGVIWCLGLIGRVRTSKVVLQAPQTLPWHQPVACESGTTYCDWQGDGHHGHHPSSSSITGRFCM